MDTQSVYTIISSFEKKHRGLKKCNHFISIIEDTSVLGVDIREDVKGIFGARDNETIVVASSHETEMDVLNTLKHEIYGHFGLNTLTQEDKIDILLSIVHLQDDELKNEWEAVRFDYPNEREFRQAEEVFCRIASTIDTKIEIAKVSSSTPESKSEIVDIVKFIKMNIQAGDVKRKIIPENNSLQFHQELSKAEYIAKKTTGKKINTLSSVDSEFLIEKYGDVQAVDTYSALIEIEIEKNKYIISSNSRVATISKRDTWNEDLFTDKNNFTSDVSIMDLTSIESKIAAKIKRTGEISKATKERIIAYGSLMDDKALIEAVESEDKEDLAALGDYFQELSQNEYLDYESFDSNQLQEMR